MGLTKTQIGYLQDKLSREVSKKIEDFKHSLGKEQTLAQAILEEVKAGKVKLFTGKDLMKILDESINSNNRGYYSYSNPSFYITDFIPEQDKERIEKELDKRGDKIKEFTDKLEKAKTEALDKIVLEGVDVETAMAILDKVK